MILDLASLKELLIRASVSGYEGSVGRFFIERLKDCSYFQEVDALNNAYSYCGNRNAAKTVMLEAHMDEIGFQVFVLKFRNIKNYDLDVPEAIELLK